MADIEQKLHRILTLQRKLQHLVEELMTTMTEDQAAAPTYTTPSEPIIISSESDWDTDDEPPFSLTWGRRVRRKHLKYCPACRSRKREHG